MKTTCINCPMGCELNVFQDDGQLNVTGNSCKKGIEYGKQEFVMPLRMVTTLIKHENGKVVPVKTSAPISKSQIFELLNFLKTIVLTGKIEVGDVLFENVFNLNVDLICTKTV